MSKSEIEAHILKAEAHKVAIKHLEENLAQVNQFIANIRDDEDGVKQGEIEPETLSHNTEDQDMTLAMQQKANLIKAQIKLINGYKNAKPTAIVDPGSLVFVQDHVFYISTSVESFNHKGYKITCLSVEAPIYKAMKGLTTGDTFEYNGRSYTIKKIA
ncbi:MULTISPECIES: hypothetical protein [unclassified Saccharicrinis]|uniref:hypothetical protein n=1 Tax=unclassified Saccharicrinis TaxID=2646859 RepID=UPI003D330056